MMLADNGQNINVPLGEHNSEDMSYKAWKLSFCYGLFFYG